MVEDDMAAAGIAQAVPEPRYEIVEHVLRRIQVRVTPQRMIVLDALLAHPGHCTAENILHWAAAQYAGLNLATVYRVLELFIAKGLVARTYLGGNAATFEFVGDAIHHHLVCQQCGAVTEVNDDQVLPMRAALAQVTGFVILPRPLTIVGICHACQLAPAQDSDQGPLP